ncbi:hypothetical protein PK98_06525 [Croceibacterium mercuriale]|uniref:Uncharacterized protein n=1 Tax=Croceibacterium mercuriale TaxID=1572751 RepID=A0A0B2C1L6_9SPHN|nr:hypothetical protein [Croceibacterium mercuriale]KHL26157.1 hypothetical protein PK98_06525 [Croceibacterium mercuriale]
MTGQSHPASNRIRPTAFLLWGWALLLLVLLSAAPTGAQPCARLIGSAFDPSTVSVTVRPSTREESTGIKLRWAGPTDDAPDLPPRLLATLDLAAASQAFVSAQELPDIAVPAPASVSGPLSRSHPARAPPIS